MPNATIQNYLNDTSIDQSKRRSVIKQLESGFDEARMESLLNEKYGNKYSSSDSSPVSTLSVAERKAPQMSFMPKPGVFDPITRLPKDMTPTPQEEKGVGDSIIDLGVGAAKEFISGTGATLADIGEKGIQATVKTLLPKSVEKKLGIDKPVSELQTSGQIARESETFEPTNTAQKIGGVAEQIGEFFVPVGAAAKAGKFIKGAKALQTAEGAGTLARAGKAIGRGLVTPAVEAATTGGVSALQEGELNQNVATNAALGAALPVVAGVGAGVKKFAGKYLPEALTKAALNLTKNQKVAIKGITSGGDTAESYLLRNQISGEPAEISRQLLGKSKLARKTKLETLEKLGGVFKNVEGEKIAKQLTDTLQVPGLEDSLSKADEILQALEGEGATLKQLDELKSMADEFASPYNAAGNVKDAAAAKGMKELRSGLQKFIEDESAKQGATNIRALNNEIRLTRKIGDVVKMQDVGAGGNALGKLSDYLVGGSVFAGVGGGRGDAESFVKAALIGTGSVLLKRAFTPAVKIKLANALSKSFNGGEAGRILKFLNGASDVKLKPVEKYKLSEALVDAGMAKRLSASEQKLLPAGAIPLPAAKSEVKEAVKKKIIAKKSSMDEKLLSKLSENQRARFNAGTKAEQKIALDDLRFRNKIQNLPIKKAEVAAPTGTKVESLIVEAKKYKSAEEFVDAMNKNRVKTRKVDIEKSKGLPFEIYKSEGELIKGVTLTDLEKAYKGQGWLDSLNKIWKKAHAK